jgi:hypothetical protein
MDPWFKDNTLEVERRYKKLGGKIEVIVKKGVGHYPLAPEDPAPVVDFITRAASTTVLQNEYLRLNAQPGHHSLMLSCWS